MPRASWHGGGMQLETPDARAALPPRMTRLGRWVLLACAALWAASLIVVLVAIPEGAPTSADPGAPVVPHWASLLPPAVGILVALLLPLRPVAQPALPGHRGRLVASTVGLLALAAAFPIVASQPWVGGEEYVLAKAVLLVAVPAVLVLALRGAVRIERRRGAWRWWAPALVVAAWALVQLGPWRPASDFSAYDPTTIIVGALATAITAGVGEELFYRRWLQTRLEAILGAWPGIALATTLFALMHVFSHGTGDPIVDVARVVVAQGSFGLFVAIVWWRYRSLAAIIVAHLLINGWGPLVHLMAS